MRPDKPIGTNIKVFPPVYLPLNPSIVVLFRERTIRLLSLFFFLATYYRSLSIKGCIVIRDTM